MGVYVFIETLEGDRHPDWLWGASGDRAFAGGAIDLPRDFVSNDECDLYHYRPTDFAAWRAWVAARTWSNPGRFEQLLDILEADESYWIRVSW